MWLESFIISLTVAVRIGMNRGNDIIYFCVDLLARAERLAQRRLCCLHRASRRARPPPEEDDGCLVSWKMKMFPRKMWEPGPVNVKSHAPQRAVWSNAISSVRGTVRER